MLSACKLYISEGRNQKFLQAITDLAGSQKGIGFLDAHIDRPYNRTGLLLAAEDPTLLLEGAASIAQEVLTALDLQQHQAHHPRIGVIDHISCSPLCASEPSYTAIQSSVELARNLGKLLGSGQRAVPVYLYGHASQKGVSLPEIRRALGYFEGSQTGLWNALATGSLDHFRPDYGPSHVSQRSGVVTIGASLWITNYNLLLQMSDMQEARRIARAVSGRGGGIEGVESMALKHDEGIEVACNLRHASASLQQKVLAAVEAQCQPLGVKVLDDYVIGKMPGEYIEQARHLLKTVY